MEGRKSGHGCHLTLESADEPDGRVNPVLDSFKFLIVIPLKDDHICRL
jgi:hypothetical protein